VARNTDEEIIAWVKEAAETTYHPVGTCRMGADALAVVDDQLRVRGIEGLRVADASIMPTLTSGNTNAPSIMIGEKVADMVLKPALAEIFRAQLDGSAVRRTVGGMIPGIVIAGQRRCVGNALFRHQAFEGVEPVPVVCPAGVGIARRLRPLDLGAERRGPFRPGEQAARVQGECHGEGLRLPRLAKHRALGVQRNAQNGNGLPIHHAGSR
jgi:hypothetical protein